MAFDNNLQLFEDLTFDGASANGPPIPIGRTGLPHAAQIAASVELPDAADGTLTVTIKLSLDGTNYIETVAVLTFLAGFAGQQASPVGLDFPWQKYAGSNIKLRATVADADNDGLSAWGKVRVWIGQGEEAVYGRAVGIADDIVGD